MYGDTEQTGFYVSEKFDVDILYLITNQDSK